MLSRRLLRIKVVKALFAHLKSGADNMMASEKTLMASVDKAYDLYFQILTITDKRGYFGNGDIGCCFRLDLIVVDDDLGMEDLLLDTLDRKSVV